ncbi:MAG TPA: alkaline phosphatase PhoX [Nostoc sp.]|uniref:alkaline phosphatase PhoX n=1 Tax=Nostoc sp. TaxID=1180 RepID=UPI002D474395|nr:alkaline phosphatase PhoX [Nostoc sp.]HYX15956.1 alkaline phosphatase PhoX [Nostoc sp.]
MRLNLKSPDKSSGLCFICGLLNASRKFVPALFHRNNRNGNLWMMTDISTSKTNSAVKSRTSDDGKPTSISGLFGNNSIWYIPTSGDNAGKAFLFGTGPMKCETTGLCFTPDEQNMFLSIQHPGEANGIRKNQAIETREFLVTTITGEEFTQTRQVPIGSNWPSKDSNAPPKPTVVVVTKSANA